MSGPCLYSKVFKLAICLELGRDRNEQNGSEDAMLFYDITDYGAVKNSKELATEAIVRAIDAAYEAGGGTVHVPAGTFVTGAIRLKSNIELRLSPGAILSFSANPDDYPVVESRWEGVKRQVYSPCIFGSDLHNVAITGSGMLDGNGHPWWDKHRNRPEELGYPRPTMIGFYNCQRVTIRDINLINSPSWTINPICCQDRKSVV